MALHPHIKVPQGPEPVRYTSPSAGPRDTTERPFRARAVHANLLVQKLETIAATAVERRAEQTAIGLHDGLGIYVTFVSEPNFELAFESLDLTRSGVELCTVKTGQDGVTRATIFVPDGKLPLFLKKVEDYRDKDTTPRTEGGPTHPKNENLVASISDIRLAALEALWAEPDLPFPQSNAVATWEVWLRRATGVDHLARLREYATSFALEVGEETISFVDRQVVLVRGTAADVGKSLDLLGAIAELRMPKVSASFFTDMKDADQDPWVADLAGRLQAPPADAPAVCLLDTGVNHGHPLLAPAITPADLHTYDPAWGTDDKEGHGTPMGGLAAFGDLTALLTKDGPVPMTHALESVKLINKHTPHDPELYGAITREGAYRVETTAPDRTRVFCMAITAEDTRDRGRPTSWSGAVDELAYGKDGEPSRFIVVAAGNTDATQRHLYPDSNMTDGIHDPAQAWNVLTVGGYTEKVTIDGTKYPGWQPLAPYGDLAPASCTSLTWGRQKWPIKPDIVMEAGNMGRNPAVVAPDYIDDALQLLTTGHKFQTQRALVSFGDTSAATATASQYAARIWAKYPNLKPETVRALIVHSARWTPAMLARCTNAQGVLDHKTLVRCFGRGVPDVRRMLSSLDNSLTLIVESDLQPFFKDADDGRVKTREMRLHPLPWPNAELAALGETQVTMRVNSFVLC